MSFIGFFQRGYTALFNPPKESKHEDAIRLGLLGASTMVVRKVAWSSPDSVDPFLELCSVNLLSTSSIFLRYIACFGIQDVSH